jgi:hypothetical protein
MVAVTGADIVATAGLLLVFLYSLPHLLVFGSSGADRGVLLLFAYAFATIIFLANVIGFIRRPNSQLAPGMVTAIGNGLLLLAWILRVVPHEMQSLIISAWMFVFVVGAFVVFRLSGRREPFYVYAGLGAVMLATATAVELQGPALTIAYTLESALLIFMVTAVTKRLEATQAASLVLVGPVMISFSSVISPSWRDGIFHSDFAVLFILAVTLMGLGYYLWEKFRLQKTAEENQMGPILLVIGSIYAYAIIWLSLHAMAIPDDLAVTVALIIYTVVGLGFYLVGRKEDKPMASGYGGVLLAFVVGRLLVVDVWGMDIVGRVVVFLAIGVLLISTAFIGRKKTTIGGQGGLIK